MKKRLLIANMALCAVLIGAAHAASAQISVDVISVEKEMGAAVCATLSKPLGIGASDASTAGEVTRLQNILRNEKYMTAAATGYFGTTTKEAVMSYQGEHGIPATGFVGTLTRAAIEKDCVDVPAAADIEISVRTDKAEYRRDENIKIAIRVENEADGSVTLKFPTACQAGYIIDGYDVLRGVCRNEPGQVMIEEDRAHSWLMSHKPSRHKLSPGTYVLTGYLKGYGSATTSVIIK